MNRRRYWGLPRTEKGELPPPPALLTESCHCRVKHGLQHTPNGVLAMLRTPIPAPRQLFLAILTRDAEAGGGIVPSQSMGGRLAQRSWATRTLAMVSGISGGSIGCRQKMQCGPIRIGLCSVGMRTTLSPLGKNSRDRTGGLALGTTPPMTTDTAPGRHAAGPLGEMLAGRTAGSGYRLDGRGGRFAVQ